jgi:anti-anti-sigma regulatory factor
MLKIQRSPRGQEVVFVLSGQMDAEHVAQLQTLISSETSGQRIVLDLKDLTLAGQDAVSFLALCEAEGIALKNCPAYVREWITGQRHES